MPRFDDHSLNDGASTSRLDDAEGHRRVRALVGALGDARDQRLRARVDDRAGATISSGA